MTISAGLLIILLSPGILISKKAWIKIYPIVLSLIGLGYHYFSPTYGSLNFSFVGFTVDLFRYNQSGYFLAFAFFIFGFCAYIFLWQKEKDSLYYLFSLWQMGAAAAILFCGDFLSFFIFWEIISLSSVGLLLKEGNLHQAKTYFIFHLAGALFLLLGIGFNYSATKEMTLNVVRGYPLFFIAIMVKGAILPFHHWLVSVYPTIKPETTVFMSAYTTKVGIFSLILLSPELDLQLFGGIIAVIAVFYALKQHRMSKLLSFHLISQMGYVIAVIGSKTDYSQAGAIYHLINNIFYKGLLFMIATFLIYYFGTDDLIIIKGKGRSKPFLFITTVIAAGSIAGLPFLNGFISKMIIKKGLTNILAGHLLTIAGIGTALSFVKVLYYGFLSPENNLEIKVKSNLSQYIAMGILVFICVALGLYPGLITVEYGFVMDFWKWPYLWKGFWPILLATILFAVCYEQLNLLILKITPELSGLNRLILRRVNRCLRFLQQVHSGNVQHYLVWIVVILVVLWSYIVWIV